MDWVIKHLKGVSAVIVSGVGMLLLGWLMRWMTIGLLSVPLWATVVIVLALGYFIYVAVSLLGVWIAMLTIKIIFKTSRFWMWCAILLTLAVTVNNSILFWTVDAPYSWREIIVSGLVMLLYWQCAVRSMSAIYIIQEYELLDTGSIWCVKLNNDKIYTKGKEIRRKIIDDMIEYEGYNTKSYEDVLFLDRYKAFNFYFFNKEYTEKPRLLRGYTTSDVRMLVEDFDRKKRGYEYNRKIE